MKIKALNAQVRPRCQMCSAHNPRTSPQERRRQFRGASGDVPLSSQTRVRFLCAGRNCERFLRTYGSGSGEQGSRNPLSSVKSSASKARNTFAGSGTRAEQQDHGGNHGRPATSRPLFPAFSPAGIAEAARPRRVAFAVGDGAAAVTSVHNFLAAPWATKQTVGEESNQ